MTKFTVFDGHNDLLSCLLHEGDSTGGSFISGRPGDLDLQKCRAGGFAGGFFAVWCSNDPSRSPDPTAKFRAFPAIDVTLARQETTAQIAGLIRLTTAHPHAIRLCRSAPEIEAARAAGAIAALLHIEGCEAIGADLNELYLYHAAGLRSLGPVWSRPNIFGHGVPFNHPASPDIGPGLTDEGKALLRACNQMNILFDLSHLNEAGFWDVAKLSTKPLVATHSNAHAITPSSRNLTDRQLRVIRDSGGMVGLNFATSFLRRDGKQSADMGWEDVLAHLDHLLGILGEDHLGLGSDFDGATTPQGIGDVTGLPALQKAMMDHGYGEALMKKLCSDNWLALLDRSWKA